MPGRRGALTCSAGHLPLGRTAVLVALAEGQSIGSTTLESIGIAVFYLFFMVMGVITYRGSFTWYWRLGMIVAFLVTTRLVYA